MNRLPAVITHVEVHGGIALVEAAVGKQRFTATLVGADEEIAAWSNGMAVTLLFQETEVSLAKNLSGMISMRNRLAVRVADIRRGKLLTSVTLDFGAHRLESIITTRASHALELEVGDAIEALVKANEMTVVPHES
jgi:molybdate transport system regulatory protein